MLLSLTFLLPAVNDEVHCLSEWDTFQNLYLNLAKTIDKLSPKDENGKVKSNLSD